MFAAGYIQRTIKALYAFLLLCLIHPFCQASEVSITQPYVDTLLCKGGSLTVPLYYNSGTPGYYDDTNSFYIELSDAAGSFSTPSIIGTAVGTFAPYINCYIFPNIISGTGYRIRVRTTYPAEVSADNGKNIRISPYPQFTLSGNTPLCTGSTLSLNATLTTSISPVTYTWKGPSGFSSGVQNATRNSVTVLDKGFYVLSATYHGCTAKDSIPIQIIAAPTKMNIRTNSPLCSGEELFILTDCDDCKLPGVSCSYSMKLPGGTIISNNNLLVKNVTAAFAGKYVVSVSVLGCNIKDSMTAIIKPQPDSPSHTVNTPLCLGDTLKLRASSNQPGVSFVWTGPNGFTAGAGNVNIPAISYSGAGVYSVKAYLNGCASAAKTNDSVMVGTPLSAPSISGKTTVCQGDSIHLLAIGNNQFGTFDWYYNNNYFYTANPLIRQYVTQSFSGYYKVVQKYNGCISSLDSVWISVPVVPKPAITINNPVCFGQRLGMHIEYLAGAEYKWKGPTLAVSAQDATINNVSYADSGRYTAIVSINGCADSTVTQVKVLPLPILTSAGSNSAVCDGDSLRLWATSKNINSDYVWTGPGGFVSDQQNPVVLVNMGSAGKYIVQAVSGICKSIPYPVDVSIKERPLLPEPKANKTVLDFSETLYLSSYSGTPEVSYSWSGPDNYHSLKQYDTLYNVKPSMAGDYVAIVTGTNGCSNEEKITITVNAIDNSKYTVYPNPNHGNFTVYGELSDDAYIVYDVLDEMGRRLKSGDIMSSKKSFRLNIDLQGAAASGVYYLHLSNANNRKNKVAIPISIIR